MNHETRFEQAWQQLPMVAILRGITPDEAIPMADMLYAAGWRMLEVPLNSPDPLNSIHRLLSHCGDRMLVGAGTVLEVDQVQQLAALGAQLVVSPNCNPEVIRATRAAGMISLPGVQTATECFAALAAGAHGLKFFPAELVPPGAIRALRSVLPSHCKLLPVGGVTPDTMADYVGAGANGFGIGGALYKAGDSVATVRERALRFTEAWQRHKAQS
ncbi:2-dehydro-3-deoxy-6-phosphogalactonate aldolase [Leeia aquatica]|uniref:2-dehydro-3-deoxy-6-phosphogalactonate aldolase n=1 Tax=Leeia aquatica TaxID=2725557 RepID=A0A847SD88_9NEIS|nr:2-dehydro-3-deoxy-6-phosphogalactonate aldolase [Leeia aquatica]NLR76807.1 2-dehydro-3-deoxy-6-phosphogalactonate aldolase [Leeia aquatica]